MDSISAVFIIIYSCHSSLYIIIINSIFLLEEFSIDDIYCDDLLVTLLIHHKCHCCVTIISLLLMCPLIKTQFIFSPSIFQVTLLCLNNIISNVAVSIMILLMCPLIKTQFIFSPSIFQVILLCLNNIISNIAMSQ